MEYIFVVTEDKKVCKKAFATLNAALTYVHAKYSDVIDDDRNVMQYQNNTCVRYLNVPNSDKRINIFIHELYL
jgi:hypothetical protein